MGSTVGIIVSGSGVAGGLPKEKKCEHPQLARAVLHQYAQTTSRLGVESFKARLKNVTDRMATLPLSPGTPLAIPGGIAELFGYRLGHAAGVRVPRVELRPGMPTDEECHDYYIKKVDGGYMMSERVPRSMPVFFLSKECETLPPSGTTEKLFRGVFVDLFDKRCPISKDAYDDFEATPEALDAARWNSPQRLLQYVYRAFLHCTYPHTSNVLTDVDGNLWLIDFEKTYISNEDDIGLLYAMIKDSPEVTALCRRIGEITPEQISAAFEGVPEGFWRVPGSLRKRYGVHNNPQSAAEYFIGRLKRWQDTFTERTEVAHAS